MDCVYIVLIALAMKDPLCAMLYAAVCVPLVAFKLQLHVGSQRVAHEAALLLQKLTHFPIISMFIEAGHSAFFTGQMRLQFGVEAILKAQWLSNSTSFNRLVVWGQQLGKFRSVLRDESL